MSPCENSSGRSRSSRRNSRSHQTKNLTSVSEPESRGAGGSDGAGDEGARSVARGSYSRGRVSVWVGWFEKRSSMPPLRVGFVAGPGARGGVSMRKLGCRGGEEGREAPHLDGERNGGHLGLGLRRESTEGARDEDARRCKRVGP